MSAAGAAEFGAALVRWRRQFHASPEPGFCEFRTASNLIDELEQLGYDVVYGPDAMDPSAAHLVPEERVADWYRHAHEQGVPSKRLKRMSGGATAVVAELRCGPGPTIAYRFDIDALPLQETDERSHKPASEGFASRHPGWMHACGHDGHMAIGLGVAASLAAQAHDLGGTVRLLFQPAEEGALGGAAAIAARGFVDDIDYLLCCHLGLEARETGLVVCRTNFMATSKYRVTFTGSGAHVVNAPQDGRNALLAAAATALALHAITPTSDGWFSLNVGVLNAGSEQGVTPALASIDLGFWAETAPAQAYVRDRVHSIIEGIADAWRVEAAARLIGEAPSSAQSEELAAVVRRVAERVPGVTRISDYALCRAGEDATVLLQRVAEHGGQGTYVLIGSSLADGHHSPRFDFDERSLSIGVELLVSAGCELLRTGREA
jgi:aminobenzoyl-glutamate utilization protein A